MPDRSRRRAAALLTICCALAACHATTPAPDAGPQTAPQAATPAPRPAGQSPDSQAVNDRLMNEVLATIAGRETEPASQVFKNVQLANLKTVPARQLLTIMNRGYSAALGVTCAHCHATADYASDDKRPKRAARQMVVMSAGITTQLRAMSELATQPPERRAVNCSTCHRGMVNPMAAR